MTNYLEFEKPLAEIEGKAEELRAMARANEEMDIEKEAAALDKKAADLLKSLYADLSAWRKCQVARHPDRPHCRDYIDTLFTEYTPLAGDRNFADDHAVMGGLARLDGTPVMVIGHEKGFDTKTRIEHNFGMARPEGYRKAIRLMELADKFGIPIARAPQVYAEAAALPAGQGAKEEHQVGHDQVVGPARPGHGVGNPLHQLPLHGGGGLLPQVLLGGEPPEPCGFAHHSHSIVAGGLEVRS